MKVLTKQTGRGELHGLANHANSLRWEPRRPSAQSSRTSNNEVGFHVVLVSLPGLSINEGGQRVKCLFGHLGARQSNGSKSGLSELTQINIVKANQGNVFWDPQFRVVYCSQRADGRQLSEWILIISSSFGLLPQAQNESRVSRVCLGCAAHPAAIGTPGGRS